MILTSVGNQKVFEKVADAMLTQHPRLHEVETARPPTKQFGSMNRWPSKGGQFERKKFVKKKFVTKAFMAHACSDESCCSEQEKEESSDGDEDFTSYFCQSSGADGDFEDVADMISQDIVTAFFASAECPEDIEDGTAEICAQAVFDEQVAFFSRENARAAGVKVNRHVHPYRPTSELSLDERKKRMEAVKKKSTCKACGKVGRWANDAICEMQGKKHHSASTRTRGCRRSRSRRAR